MNDEISNLECPQPLAGDRTESVSPPTEFTLIQRGDYISPGWWHWRCRCEDAAGNVDYGYVQADSLGQAVAPKTFEKDQPTPAR